MTRDQQQAAERLATVLQDENAALAVLEYHRVADFVDEKRAALDALNAASTGVEQPADPDPQQRALALRLQRLVDENRELLRQAIKVQNRIMGVVAGAARLAQVPTGYGASGRRPRSGLASAIALIVRA